MTETKGNYHTRIKRQYLAEELAQKPVGVMLPIKLDEYVRSQPNKSEWLRKAIARQVEEDLKNAL